MLTTRSHSLRMWGVPSLPIVRTAVPVPAQLMAMRSGASSAAAATASATCSASVTSHLTNFTPSSWASASPFSELKSMTVTTAPAACRRRTVASPSPEAPPLTIAAAPVASMAPQTRDGGLHLATSTTGVRTAIATPARRCRLQSQPRPGAASVRRSCTRS